MLSLRLIESAVLPILDRLSTDKIPNIRFNVAKSYGILIDVLKHLPESGTLSDADKQESLQKSTTSPRCKEIIESTVLPILKKLQEDDDVDVRYFAVTASQKWEGGQPPEKIEDVTMS